MPEIITPGKHETLPCKFCHTPLEVGEGLVCRFCKGLEEQYPAPVELEESLRVCGVCGDYFGQYKNGSQAPATAPGSAMPFSGTSSGRGSSSTSWTAPPAIRPGTTR